MSCQFEEVLGASDLGQGSTKHGVPGRWLQEIGCIEEAYEYMAPKLVPHFCARKS